MIQQIISFREKIKELETEVLAYVDDSPDVNEAANALLQLNLAKRDIGSVYDSLSFAFGNLIGNEKELQLENGAVIEKKMSYERRAWQHKDLARAVADKLVKMSVDVETGEVLQDTKQLITDALGCAGISYWKVAEVSGLGIDVDNYCEAGQLKTSIIVRKGTNE